MPQGLALQQGASQLQTSEDLWTLPINIHHFSGYIFLILMMFSYLIIVSAVLFYCLLLHFSLVLVLGLVYLLLCTLLLLACYMPLAVGKHLKKVIELNWIIMPRIRLTPDEASPYITRHSGIFPLSVNNSRFLLAVRGLQLFCTRTFWFSLTSSIFYLS
jgi:hypothetical protein